MTLADAIPAATLVVLRDRADGVPDILMVKRSAKMAFAGGAVVFPGGRVDSDDHDLAAGFPLADAAAAVTAIRETIEECGVAVGFDRLLLPEEGAELQRALLAGEPFARLLDQHRLGLDLAALTPFARWMPAFKQPRKFDTLFLLAEAPAGDWRPRPQPGECDDAFWTGAGAMLAAIERGEAAAIFPTKRNLERLARFSRFADAVADARAHRLDRITPWIEDRDGEPHVCIPADQGYPVTSEPLATAFRA